MAAISASFLSTGFDDCWLEIFKHLDFASHIRIGRTCKLFHRILHLSLVLPQQKTLFARSNLDLGSCILKERFCDPDAAISFVWNTDTYVSAESPWLYRCRTEQCDALELMDDDSVMELVRRSKTYGSKWQHIDTPVDAAHSGFELTLCGGWLILCDRAGSRWVLDSRSLAGPVAWKPLPTCAVEPYTYFTYQGVLCGLDPFERDVIRYDLDSNLAHCKRISNPFGSVQLPKFVVGTRLYAHTGLYVCLETYQWRKTPRQVDCQLLALCEMNGRLLVKRWLTDDGPTTVCWWEPYADEFEILAGEDVGFWDDALVM